MQLGMIGLGRMGANMARRVMSHGHQCVVQDANADAVAKMVADGAVGATTLQEMAAKMTRPRAVWMMVPAAVVDHVLDDLLAHLDPGDIIIDGGNSWYRDDIDRAKRLKDAGYHYVDCGTSGGIAGHDRGYCLMVGAEPEIFEHLSPILKALAPGVDAASRTPGCTGDPSNAENGFLHCGPNGAGHFVKMVHNGIEYGMMAAFAEGFNILKHANIGKQAHAKDAETAPMREPQYYQFDIDVAQVAEVWRRGSVVGSWLLDLTAKALVADPQLAAFGGRVSDSGEGRWTIQAAIDEGVPTQVLSAALYDRFSSRGEATFANQILSAMRSEFGGHAEKKAQ
ncbi:MAG: phosphogluconate dehydrogenase (NAD(+)-dependent, decarboxylating) [Burkholderiaceae bacterium]